LGGQLPLQTDALLVSLSGVRRHGRSVQATVAFVALERGVVELAGGMGGGNAGHGEAGGDSSAAQVAVGVDDRLRRQIDAQRAVGGDRSGIRTNPQCLFALAVRAVAVLVVYADFVDRLGAECDRLIAGVGERQVGVDEPW
jgi:hypothetical protein